MERAVELVLFLLQGWNTARTKIPVLKPGHWHNPCTPVYRPVLMSQQTWSSTQFPQPICSCCEISGRFLYNDFGVLLQFRRNSLDGQLREGANSLETSRNLVDLSKTQAYNFFDSSSSHDVLAELPPPAEMRQLYLRACTVSLENRLFQRVVLVLQDKCPLGHKV